MEPEPAKTFTRTFRGYQPAAVDAYVEMLTTKQQLLLDDVESLRARLKDVGDEAAALRSEVGLLTDTSPSSHAVQKRMAQMLRRTVDEVSEMQAEARAEADATIAAAEAEAEAARQKHEEVLADLAGRRETLEAEYEKTKQDLETELAGLRADAQEARDQLLADAKLEADHYREQAEQAADEAGRQRITVLEQLVGVYRDLEGVPATLESAYQELDDHTRHNPPSRNSEAGILSACPPPADRRSGSTDSGCGTGIQRAAAGWTDRPCTSASADLAHPGITARLGVGRGAGALCASVQPTRTVRP